MKYLVSDKEDIADVPYGAIILNAKLVFKNEEDEALIYLPKKLKYKWQNENGISFGCGALSFAKKVSLNKSGTFGTYKIWIYGDNDYININLKKYERR